MRATESRRVANCVPRCAICWVLGISCTLRHFTNLPYHCPIAHRTEARPPRTSSRGRNPTLPDPTVPCLSLARALPRPECCKLSAYTLEKAPRACKWKLHC